MTVLVRPKSASVCSRDVSLSDDFKYYLPMGQKNFMLAITCVHVNETGVTLRGRPCIITATGSLLLHKVPRFRTPPTKYSQCFMIC